MDNQIKYPRFDIPRKSTVAMYNLNRIPAKTIHAIRVYNRNHNSRQIDCQKVLLQENARFLRKEAKEKMRVQL